LEAAKAAGLNTIPVPPPTPGPEEQSG